MNLKLVTISMFFLSSGLTGCVPQEGNTAVVASPSSPSQTVSSKEKATSSASAKKYEIPKPHYQPEDTFETENIIQMRLDGTTSHWDNSFQISFDERSASHITVLNTESGTITEYREKVLFARTESRGYGKGPKGANIPTVKKIKPQDGATIRYRKAITMWIPTVEDADGASEEELRDFHSYTDFENNFLPRYPITMGQTWDFTPEEKDSPFAMSVRSLFPLFPSDIRKQNITGKLIKIVNYQGEDCAIMECNVTLSGEDPLQSEYITVKMNGTMTYSIQSGYFLKGVWEGSVEMRKKLGSDSVSVPGTIRMEHYSRKLPRVNNTAE
jgi:hypothetical protein